MAEQNDGGHAFPQYIPENEWHKARATGGMSLRDYFAAAALAGPLSAEGRAEVGMYTKAAMAAQAAYELADAMIEERDKKPETEANQS